MFKNVLVGVDGRPGGRDALALAPQLSAPGATTTLANVIGGVFIPSHAVTPNVIDDDRKSAQSLLEQERSSAEIDAELVVLDAPAPGRGLHERAERQGADLIVLGSSHRGAFGRAMLGDDTRDSLNGAPCAVAIAPAGYANAMRPFATVGVGYDGSPESVAALAAARELAAPTHARVSLLRVVTLPAYAYSGLAVAMGPVIDDLVKTAQAELDEIPDVDGEAEYGLPGEALASFSKDVDLLVTGSRGYGPVGRVVHGSTSNYLQRHGHAPLLVLPRSSSDESSKAAEGQAAAHA